MHEPDLIADPDADLGEKLRGDRDLVPGRNLSTAIWRDIHVGSVRKFLQWCTEAEPAPDLGRYVAMVPVIRRSPRSLDPIRRLPDLDRWTGMWVAIKDGSVIAAEETSRALAYRLRQMGPPAAGAVTEFVRPGHEDSYAVGVG